MTKRAAFTGLFAAVICVLAADSRAQYCDFPPKALTQGERREYRGLYENKAYGYSVSIPSDLVGYDAPDPLYQRGFAIILGKQGQSYILVNAEPNSLEYARPTSAASDLLGYLRRHGNKVLSSKITVSGLGTLKSAFLVAKYTCPAATGEFDIVSAVAISPDRGTVYEVTLYAHADRFGRDRAVFDALVKSWRYLGPHF